MYDVIGIQSHMHGGYWGAARVWDVCERFAKFGKPLHFTETTIVSGPKKDSGWTTTPEGEQDQAKQVTEFYTVLFSHPAVEAITWWDFTDQGAWQQAPAGLVRDDMTPKPAYEQLRSLIKGKWWTKMETATGSRGTWTFRVSSGRYEVEAKLGDRRLAGRFSLDKDLKTTVGDTIGLTREGAGAMNYAVIMAGGTGKRLWPLSRQKRPKQVLKLLDGQTLLGRCFERLTPVFDPRNILALTNVEYADLVRENLPDLPFNNVIAEPVGSRYDRGHRSGGHDPGQVRS